MRNSTPSGIWIELIHLDSKKLGRIAGIGHRFTGRAAGSVNRYHGIGWEALHVCIDDATRLAPAPARTGRDAPFASIFSPVPIPARPASDGPALRAGNALLLLFLLI